MRRDGEAVLQTLTAVWRGMRHLRKYEKEGTTLKRSNVCREQFDHLRGRRPYGDGCRRSRFAPRNGYQSWDGFTVLSADVER